MRFAHSFWTQPLKNKKFIGIHDSIAINLVEYALSLEYIHRHGYEIDLYTDKDGAELFKLLPYDNVYVIENNITDNYHFAASFKFLALDKMQLGSVLIDGDIFLQKPEVYSMIENCQSDVMVSFYEPKSYISTLKDQHIEMLNKIKRFNFKYPYETPDWETCDGWHNTSVIKLNNKSLKDEYILQYKNCASKLGDCDFGNLWPDVIIEQRNLTQLCENKNYTIDTIIKDFPSDESNQFAFDIGFAHLGDTKCQTQIQNINMLDEFNQQLVSDINDFVPKITRYFVDMAEKERR